MTTWSDQRGPTLSPPSTVIAWPLTHSPSSLAWLAAERGWHGLATVDFDVLDGVGEGSELWEKRLEGTRQITVTGTVMGTDEDKVKHLAMTSFELK